jgi:hypothetical protein
MTNIKSEEKRLLQSVKSIAAEAFGYWDDDQDMKVGKILKALSGDLPGYRADIDEIVKATE